ncbi:MAG TPA: hypothetical protein VHQ03_08345 [Candidatus Dormibacteraeota bacterium]|jgi:ABC-type antimicrobial peptide transport system permease subunit|nr:hypothetical protein [Candidatus Dormibacteraeota bacterium]
MGSAYSNAGGKRLRALGFQPPQLMAAVIAESLFAVAAGVAACVASGLAVGYLYMSRYYTGSGVGLQLGTLSIGVALAVLIAAGVTIGPAVAAARTAPAQALRLID